jgi:hypothetical protein
MRVLRVLVALGVLQLLGACAPLEPWVKPYEREHLADPIMALDRNPISSDHVFGTREGAHGATGGAGGGCGCN